MMLTGIAYSSAKHQQLKHWHVDIPYVNSKYKYHFVKEKQQPTL